MDNCFCFFFAQKCWTAGLWLSILAKEIRLSYPEQNNYSQKMDFSQITRRAFIWSIAKYISWLLALILSHSHILKRCFSPSFHFLISWLKNRSWNMTAIPSHSLPWVHSRQWRTHHLIYPSIQTEMRNRWIYILYEPKLSLVNMSSHNMASSLLKINKRGALIWIHGRKVDYIVWDALWDHTIGNILNCNKNKTKSCCWSRKYFHSGRKSNFGLSIACVWKQPVTNIAAEAFWSDTLWTIQFKGFQFLWNLQCAHLDFLSSYQRAKEMLFV